MFKGVKNAVADAAETLRRAFAGLKVRELAPEPFLVQRAGADLLSASSRVGLEPPAAELRDLPRLAEAVQGRALEPFLATLTAEAGWAHWEGGAQVTHMPPLEPSRATRVTVPPLPKAALRAKVPEAFTHPGVHRGGEPLACPATRRLDPALEAVGSRPGLALALATPVAVRGEDIQRLQKGLWMRYSLQLVKSTGENVRNLEVLGLFRIPRKGVANMTHDPRQGRILLHLEPSAVVAARAPFLLARRRDDGTLLSCYVEDP
jgi:hypothetical protein